MSNWFHRNPLKATSKVTFNLGSVAESIAARNICNDASNLRAALLKLLTDPAVSVEQVLSKTQQYLALVMGFVYPPENVQDKENKLRTFILFKWSNSAENRHASVVSQLDSMFEVCSMLFDVALWLTKHAAKVASKEDITEDEAKDVHRSLRLAAGFWILLRDQYVPELLVSPSPGHDLHCDVIEGYIQQSTAEAQEIAVARAVELKHTPGLIAGLAMETSNVYEKASLALKSCESRNVCKWIKYLEFKHHCYRACAYVYFAEHLLKQEKAGAAIAVIAEAEQAYKRAVELGKVYGRVEGVGVSAKPAEHCFFRRLGQSIANTRSKLERENCLIFHQRVPAVAPDFDLKAEYGVAKPEIPEVNNIPDERWKGAYMGFNHKKLLESIVQRDSLTKDQKGVSDRDAPVEPVSEKPIFSTDKDPKNETGCVLS